MDKCDVCTRNTEWQERYTLACERFDRSLKLALTVTVIALCVMAICIILSTMCLAQTIKFINGFECVEETVVEQDGAGKNIAVLIGGNN